MAKLESLNINPYGDPFYYDIFFTDSEGWGKILYDLIFNSNLYQTGIFTCLNYSLKAFNECCERYRLNGLLTVFGMTELGYHAFNIFYDGSGFLLWEPNEGFPFSGSAFEIGEYGYQPQIVLI